MADTTVLFFARAREVVGSRTASTAAATVADALDELADRHGEEMAELLRTCTVVVDGEVVNRSEFTTRSPGDELAVLPPVSGGFDGDRSAHVDAGPVAAMRLAVLTVSDRASAGEYDDLTGPALVDLAGRLLGTDTVDTAVVPDDTESIRSVLLHWCDELAVDLVLTNGGTGLSARDLTPESVRSVLDVEAPGIAELMRSAGLLHTPLAALSRQVAGRRGSTIILALPGSLRGATESLEAVAALIPHAVDTARA